MVLQWKSFPISLPYFTAFLKANVPDADGIVAGADSFEVIEKNPFSAGTMACVQAYYDALTAETETAKTVPSNAKIAAILSAIQDDAKLLTVMRMAVANNIGAISPARLDAIYTALGLS